MRLLAAFRFTDPSGKVWDAPAESLVDGASIPRALWSLVGSPYTGEYRRASVVHDIACDRAGSNREERRAADRMFYRACRAGGCSVRESSLLYLGVRIGATLPDIPQWSPAKAVDNSGPRLQRMPEEERLEADFVEAARLVLDAAEADDEFLIESRVDSALEAVTGRDVRSL
ncbi:MAG: DUF1353 domain-containing protein [Cyanobium sp.]